ncbi:hypothetical protein FHP26_21040 [Pseudomonas orientalis]|nr:hypothetical protein [Pseudomonas orientalis]
MLAKNVNDHACLLNERGACQFFASKLAPTISLFSCRNPGSAPASVRSRPGPGLCVRCSW